MTKLNKRSFYIIIFIVSVIGLVIVQYRYLKIGINLAEVRFNQNIGKTAKSLKEQLSEQNRLTFLLGKAISKDSVYFKAKYDTIKSASIYFLKDFINYNLVENGIKTDFSYKLYVKNTSLFLNSKNYNEDTSNLKTLPIKLEGYLPELLQKNVILELQFKKINDYFLFQLNGLTIPSLIFLIAIIIVVIWVLKSFYWQQSIITQTNEFINNLTHELKTPVFSIGLAAKMLEQKTTDENKNFVEIIKSQNNRLKEHIEKVLQLANLEKTHQAVILKKTDFQQFLKQLCEEFAAVTKLEMIDFNYQIPSENLLMKCEPMHLTNAINNLLDNSRKYKSENSKINLQAVINKKTLQIVIIDNGIGIEKQHLKNVFKKHFRVSAGDLYTVKGYGLGLYYVKKIITLHKGQIHIESELNKGTKIFIKLPLINL